MGASAIVTGSRATVRRPSLTKHEILVAGAVGAFAPQILRWYTQSDFNRQFDAWATAGHTVVVVLFLALAGYVTLLWGVRTLKEAFLVGLAVPSIVLGPGGDLATLAAPGPADAQVRTAQRTAATTARSFVGGVEVRVRASDGGAAPQFRIVAADGRGTIYSGADGFLPLPAGRYRLSISAPGYEPSEREVVVTPEHRPETIHVTLRRLSAAQRFLDGASRAIRRY